MQAWDWITVARLVTARKCRLMALTITPSAANAECYIHNGASASDPVVLRVYLATQNSQLFDFGEGLLLERGLYIGSFTNITGVLAQWQSE